MERYDVRMIRAMRSWMACVLFVGALGQALYAEDGGLIVGGVAIKLGMPQAEVMELIQKDFKLSQFPESESYLLSSKVGPPYKSLGAVGFNDNKVSSISKIWGDYSGKAVTELANALVATLDYGRGADVPATIIVQPPLRTPELTVTAIEISFGEKLVRLQITESRGSNRTTEVSVDETLLDPVAQRNRELRRLRRKN